MMYVCLAAMPIILLLRSPHKQMSGEAAQAVME
jgi:hypothetical protein